MDMGLSLAEFGELLLSPPLIVFTVLAGIGVLLCTINIMQEAWCSAFGAKLRTKNIKPISIKPIVTPLEAGKRVKKIKMVGHSAMKLLENGELYVSGITEGHFGISITGTVGQLLSASNVVDFDMNSKSACYIDTRGDLYVTGGNKAGKLGLSIVQPDKYIGVDSINEWVKVAENVAQCDIGNSVTAYVSTDGKLYVAGMTTKIRTTSGPTDSFELFDAHGIVVKKVLAGDSAIIILSEDGKVYTCGDNRYWELGKFKDKSNHSDKFIQVASDIADIHQLTDHINAKVYALTADKEILFWGQAWEDVQQPTPTKVYNKRGPIKADAISIGANSLGVINGDSYSVIEHSADGEVISLANKATSGVESVVPAPNDEAIVVTTDGIALYTGTETHDVYDIVEEYKQMETSSMEIPTPADKKAAILSRIKSVLSDCKHSDNLRGKLQFFYEEIANTPTSDITEYDKMRIDSILDRALEINKANSTAEESANRIRLDCTLSTMQKELTLPPQAETKET